MKERVIKRALISVFSKEGIDKIAHKLHSAGVEILSSGGTANFISSLGIPVVPIEEITSYPSIFGGRVKTLHPKIFGAILARGDSASDLEEMKIYDIEKIDLVIVDLYPFQESVNLNLSHPQIVEKIDIGGVSLIRGAAKNYNDLLVVSSRELYPKLLEILDNPKGSTLEQRALFSAYAFNLTSKYDADIFQYLNDLSLKEGKKEGVVNSIELRYGENPHQKGIFIGNEESLPKQLHGKAVSYNNLLDIEAAIELIAEFEEGAAVAILKHTNACGCAVADSVVESWQDALRADPVSAFGGVIVSNATIDQECAASINKIFFEVIIAPQYTNGALEILKEKQNRIILQNSGQLRSRYKYRSLLGGELREESDFKSESAHEVKVVTHLAPTPAQMESLLFANRVVKHLKSNAIVIAKGRMLLAAGVGQTSRVDALNQAIEKAKRFGFDLQDAVMASDGFFPFADSVEIAHQNGIRAIIQPGGSIRDNQSIEFCNQNKITMVTTAIRHFKH
ncbi:MAG: bifunctional phosphoribosylaminoimidazolecarboxamide formyltransferase/IMP cyclohydrolase [Bacteroidales bacterium]